MANQKAKEEKVTLYRVQSFATPGEEPKVDLIECDFYRRDGRYGLYREGDVETGEATGRWSYSFGEEYVTGPNATWAPTPVDAFERAAREQLREIEACQGEIRAYKERTEQHSRRYEAINVKAKGDPRRAIAVAVVTAERLIEQALASKGNGGKLENVWLNAREAMKDGVPLIVEIGNGEAVRIAFTTSGYPETWHLVPLREGR